MILVERTAAIGAAGSDPAHTGKFDWFYVVTVGAGILAVFNEGMQGQSGQVSLVAGDFYRFSGADVSRVTFKNPTGGALSVTYRLGTGDYRKMP